MVLELTEIRQLEFVSVSCFVLPKDIEPPPARWKCGNPAPLFLPDFPARWREWKTRFWVLSFPRFPRGVISTALFTLQFSERSDAAGASSATIVPSSLRASFSFWAKIRASSKILHQD